MTKPPSIEKLAYHEAGHAVIARLLCIGVLKVEILPGGKDGVCDHGHAWPGTDADLAAQAIGLDKDLLMECAGAAAEKYYQPDGDGFTGWLSDSTSIETLAAGAVMVEHGRPAPEILDWDEFRAGPLWGAMWQHARTRAHELISLSPSIGRRLRVSPAPCWPGGSSSKTRSTS